MNKIGRNDSCPCGSGKKYKRCCESKEAEMRQRELQSGHFRYEPGSYGGPQLGFMPSIICYKETGPESWTEHFCLVKSDVTLAEEDSATAIAEQHLAAASQVQAEGGGDPRKFALALRHDGYKAISDFRLVSQAV
jgi:SEC-C motif-containing protein